MFTLAQFEEVMRKLLEQMARKQRWEAIAIMVVSLAFGWLLSDLIPPVMITHMLHLGGYG